MWQRPMLKNRLETLHKPSIGILSGRNAPGYWTNDSHAVQWDHRGTLEQVDGHYRVTIQVP
jgi:hypothetical protein